ncbi:DNA-directed RNA polymerase subunit delta [Sporolactobacillus shoreicorticis]|uniref:DNA-directed RNA polymerase subunit delta n=1 Tax=Sporolactobacillus shoreicorticis TaxID=1923877 RepID=UPI0020984F51|nr:DNA-directed RNA polymerase subunit delta [Sporolactobacillus shoreicorticis]MCO7125594.1 DNA-directed RNA polymerase subunit delta [Sporolactobacillus shoreicorticis]
MFPLTEHVVEKSKVDQFYNILAQAKEPKTFYELTDLVYKKGEIEADGGESLARLYTTLILDGRFLSVGHNLWALRNWYPLEQREDDIAKTLGDSHHEKHKVAEDGFDDYNDEDDDDDLDIDETDDDSSDDDDYEDDDVKRIRKNAVIDDDDE